MRFTSNRALLEYDSLHAKRAPRMASSLNYYDFIQVLKDFNIYIYYLDFRFQDNAETILHAYYKNIILYTITYTIINETGETK